MCWKNADWSEFFLLLHKKTSQWNQFLSEIRGIDIPGRGIRKIFNEQRSRHLLLPASKKRRPAPVRALGDGNYSVCLSSAEVAYGIRGRLRRGIIERLWGSDTVQCD